MEVSTPGQARIAAIYARVSTDNQRAQGTITSQVDELRELAAARGLRVGPELVFCDEGVSGATVLQREPLTFCCAIRLIASRVVTPTRCCCSTSSLARASESYSRLRTSVLRRLTASCCARCRG